MTSASKNISSFFYEYETQLRFAATLFFFHIIPSLSLLAQAVMFFAFFLVHLLYLFLDLESLYNSIYVHWISSETRNVRQALLDTIIISIQVLLSVFLSATLFSQGLLKSGVLSASASLFVSKKFAILVNDIYRSGYLFAFIFTRKQLEAGKLNFISEYLTHPGTAYVLAFLFSLLSIFLKNPAVLGMIALPFVIISLYYCLDILSFSTNNQSSESVSNYLAHFLIGISHALSFASWAGIFSVSLTLFVASLPLSLSSVAFSIFPSFILTSAANVSVHHIFSWSVIALFSEVFRHRVYEGIQFNPTDKLKAANVLLNSYKSDRFKYNKSSFRDNATPQSAARKPTPYAGTYT